jgi:hypothetical protein
MKRMNYHNIPPLVLDKLILVVLRKEAIGKFHRKLGILRHIRGWSSYLTTTAELLPLLELKPLLHLMAHRTPCRAFPTTYNGSVFRA